MPLIGAKRGNIESVYIDGAYRGMGYGKQMIKYAINFAKERGVKICQLTTNKKRVDAKRFYESLGFVATHEGMKLVL
jgi:ribosomal protein S18 acetylase RimI-like enzyme